MNQSAPMVQTPIAVYVLLAIAGLLVIWSLIRSKRKPPKPRHDVVSWRVLWWRKLAPPEAVRRELAPHEPQFAESDRLARFLFDDTDAEEGDHARA